MGLISRGISQGAGQAIASAFYSGIGGGGDEAAVNEAVDEMLNMCGNEGQVTIITNGSDAFSEWAGQLLENPDADPDYEPYIIAAVGQDAFDGSGEIWEAGAQRIYDASAWHDSEDEQGEGTGNNYDSSVLGDLVNLIKRLV